MHERPGELARAPKTSRSALRFDTIRAPSGRSARHIAATSTSPLAMAEISAITAWASSARAAVGDPAALDARHTWRKSSGVSEGAASNVDTWWIHRQTGATQRADPAHWADDGACCASVSVSVRALEAAKYHVENVSVEYALEKAGAIGPASMAAMVPLRCSSAEEHTDCAAAVQAMTLMLEVLQHGGTADDWVEQAEALSAPPGSLTQAGCALDLIAAALHPRAAPMLRYLGCHALAMLDAITDGVAVPALCDTVWQVLPRGAEACTSVPGASSVLTAVLVALWESTSGRVLRSDDVLDLPEAGAVAVPWHGDVDGLDSAAVAYAGMAMAAVLQHPATQAGVRSIAPSFVPAVAECIQRRCRFDGKVQVSVPELHSWVAVLHAAEQVVLPGGALLHVTLCGGVPEYPAPFGAGSILGMLMKAVLNEAQHDEFGTQQLADDTIATAVGTCTALCYAWAESTWPQAALPPGQMLRQLLEVCLSSLQALPWDDCAARPAWLQLIPALLSWRLREHMGNTAPADIQPVVDMVATALCDGPMSGVPEHVHGITGDVMDWLAEQHE